jgi:multiple sugar transport system substrate-binding protein
MQRHVSRGISATVVLGLVATLTACSASDTAKGGDEKVVIRVGTWDGGDGLKQDQQLAASYMKAHPNVTVKVESTPTNYSTKLLTELAAGNAPDIMQLGDGDISTYQAKGVLADLTPYATGSTNGLVMSDYVPQVMDIGKIHGKYYTVGEGTSMAVYVNKDAFAAAGLSLPKADWTWDDLEKDALALTKRNASGAVTQYGIDFNGNDLRTYLPFLYAYGGDVISSDGKTVTGYADSEGSIAGWSMYNRLMNVDKVAPGTKAVGANNDNDFFLAPEGKKVGLAAMELSGDWGGPSYVQARMNFEVLPIPAGPAGQFTTMDYSGLGINARSKNTQAAWDYLKYWATTGQTTLAATGDLVPYQPALTKYKLDTNPATAEFVRSFSKVKPFPELLSPNFASSGAANDLLNVLSDIQATNGSVDVATELKAAAKKAQADLDSGSTH